MPFCFPFADDNLVGSADRRRHLEHLRQVFKIIEKYGLVLNIAKCEFGLQVSAGGKAPLAAKVAAITSLHRPSTVKELLRFLGMVNYYRCFLPAAARVLTDATRFAPKETGLRLV